MSAMAAKRRERCRSSLTEVVAMRRRLWWEETEGMAMKACMDAVSVVAAKWRSCEDEAERDAS